MDKIKYTISWTEHPQSWNIPGAIKILESARKQALDLEKKRLEESSLKETQNLLKKLRSM
jgi:hypothetical protein